MARGVTKDVRAFKQSYAQSPCIKTAALAAGYSEGIAKQGLARLPKAITSYVLAKQRKLNKLAELGKSVDAEQQENVMRGAVLSNIAEGKDKAVGSIKLGMQDKRVGMLTADVQQGIIVLNVPEKLARSLDRSYPDLALPTPEDV